MQTSADQTTAVRCRLQCLGAAQHTRGHIFSVNLAGFLLCGGGDGGDGLGAAVGDCQDIVAEIHSNKMIMSARFTARADIYHIWCTGQPIFMGSLEHRCDIVREASVPQVTRQDALAHMGVENNKGMK